MRGVRLFSGVTESKYRFRYLTSKRWRTDLFCTESEGDYRRRDERENRVGLGSRVLLSRMAAILPETIIDL